MRRWIVVFALEFALCFSSAAASESAESLFLEANDLFQKGLDSPAPDRAERIHQAASLYERIIKEKGIRNGYLFYNIGNCYFHLGEIGKAILNYRRAEKLIPNYSDLKRNLRSAQARRKDNIEKSQIRSIARTLFFWHYLMSRTTKIAVFSTVFSAIWIMLLLKLFFDRPVMNWGAAVCIFFSVAFGASAPLDYYEDYAVRSGVIVAQTTLPRKGPGDSYAASFKEPLHEGTEFRLKDRQGVWVQIELDNGSVCWVNSKHVEMV